MKMGCSLLFLLIDARVQACLEEHAHSVACIGRQGGQEEKAHIIGNRVLFFARAHLARARVIGLTQGIIFARACT